MTWLQRVSPVLCLILLASCRNIKSLTAKDMSGNKKVNVTVRKQPGKPVFIEDITIKGDAETKPQTTTVRKVVKKPKTNQSSGEVDNSPMPTVGFVSTEELTGLQLKYAIELDATAERLRNLPLLQQIELWWGTRYCLGGNTQNCIDCSGFTTVILRDVYGVSIPRTSQEQYDRSEKIETEQLQEGDLVFFGSGTRINHVGVYLTNNKFVHASTSQGVMISDLNDRYWQPRFRGGGRFIIR